MTIINAVAESKKIMCRITKDGSSLAGDNPETEVVRAQEEYLVRLLQEGYNRDKEQQPPEYLRGS